MCSWIITICFLLKKHCRGGPYGCKDQLLINQIINGDCKSKHGNLSMAWIDYCETFDSVLDSWILKALDLITISPVLIIFFRINMSMW